MIQIRPVSDLRNKYPEVERLVTQQQATGFLDQKWLWQHGRDEH